MTDTPLPENDDDSLGGNPSPVPGWYADTSADGDSYRWWDGSTWTHHTAADPAVPLPSSAGSAASGTEGSTATILPVGQLLTQLFRILAGQAGHLFPVVLVVMVIPAMFNGMMIRWAWKDSKLTFTDDGLIEGLSGPPLSVAQVFGVTISFVLVAMAGIWTFAAAMNQARSFIDGEPMIWSQSIQSASRRLPHLVALWLLMAVLAFVSMMVVLLVGAIALPLLPVLLLAWLVAVVVVGVRLVTTPDWVLQGYGPVASLKSGWKVTKRNVFSILGRLFAISMIAVGVWLMSSIIAVPFTAIAGGSGQPAFEAGQREVRIGDFLGDNPAVYAISQLFGAVGTGTTLAVWAVGLTLIANSLQRTRPINGPSKDDQPV